ncbi:MAG: hypothetical protein HY774_20765 [Acidobacteria bacterium]|nr:hypothetical protein [Acidobacteriota bacterium]
MNSLILALCCVHSACTAAGGVSPQSGRQISSPPPMSFAQLLIQQQVHYNPTSLAERKIIAAYGAVWAASGNLVLPDRVIFANQAEVSHFQQKMHIGRAQIGKTTIELQEEALVAWLKARQECLAKGVSLTPRGGASAARRDYVTTISLWKSRVTPGLNFHVKQKRVTAQEAARIQKLSIPDQIEEILRLEEQGLYFSKSLDKSILYSVAPPGASQHLALLAIDIEEYENAQARAILANHGWFQTVVSDLPHFTYLGLPEAALAARGLKKEVNQGRAYWVPNL